jgi:indole-3-glycerol phosphate synthase
VSGDFLKTIAAEKLAAIKEKEAYYANLKKNMKPRDMTRYEVFKKAISRPGQINLIAEIKKASPSVGLIREDFEVIKIAKVYTDNKAAALSILTEEKYFLGKFAYLKKVADEFYVPLLMKDFIVHEYQIYEGSFYGASAILLIVAMLSDTQMKDLMDVAHALGLDCLVEVHSEEEIERAVKCQAQIIGVNNRDLRSLKVDIDNCLRMIPRIPRDKVIVAESGLRTHDDIKRVSEVGAHAVLIGETFMRANDIGAKIKEVMYGKN